MASVSACVRACPYLDDGRWWSDPVVAAGCMVLCLATCVLIIAELGVCGRQKELLQLRVDPIRRRKEGEDGEKSNDHYPSNTQTVLCKCTAMEGY